MLNYRTFPTLSATSDRLNLGTRSLAATACAFNVVAPRLSLDDRHERMDFLRKEIGMITGKSQPGFIGGIPASGSPPTGHDTPWVSWTCQRGEVVADQPTPSTEVVVREDVRRPRRRRPVRTVRAAAAVMAHDASALWVQSGPERRLMATAATSDPSPPRCASRAAGG
jgi:hypothetical protein